MTTALMSDMTRAMALYFGRLLAQDIAAVQSAEPSPAGEAWVEAAGEVLIGLDRFEAWPDEESDWNATALERGSGELWLRVAESGRMNVDYVAHVLSHLGKQPSYPGPAWVRTLLSAISLADEETLDQLAISVPEYVGLWRAYRHVDGAADRMRAVVTTT